jgi:phage protein D
VTAAQALREPVECVVTVDGTEITDFYRFLKEVRVEMSRRAAAMATLVFDTVRKESGVWNVQDEGPFLPWKRIQIDARFGSRREEVMRGFIKEVRAECPQDMSSATVTVTAQDESLLLDREHVRASMSREDAQLSDGQIAQQIASDHGLGADAEPGQTHTSLNADATYIRFLQDRAEANGFELLVRAGTLVFKPPELAGAPQPTILVYAGRDTNCLRFTASYDGHRPDQVRVMRAAERGTEIDDQTVGPDLPLLGRTAATSSGAGLAPFVWTLPRPNGATAAEAQARAQARANENAWKITAEGELDGALYGSVLLTHRTVNVDGVGDTYGGLYYVDEVRHTFNTEGYRQTFKLLRNALGDQQGASSDRLAAVRS